MPRYISRYSLVMIFGSIYRPYRTFAVLCYHFDDAFDMDMFRDAERIHIWPRIFHIPNTHTIKLVAMFGQQLGVFFQFSYLRWTMSNFLPSTSESSLLYC